uniref:CUB domain-containing protein n=1 Tax=Rhabditophanes sp. KR3021 TaxID=114890 RepID=A0AC35TJA2_9BILA
LGTGGSSTPVPSSTTTDILSSTTTAYRLNSCPSSLYNKPTGILTSTNYPQNYLNYLDCYYQINAAVGERILLTINDFVTQSGYDYLQIYGERTSLKRLTGRLTNLGQSYNFVSASNYMGLQFHSDSSIVAKGWSATYISKSFPSVQYINTTTDVKYKGWQISWTPQLVANLGTGGSSTPVPSSTTTDILSSTTTAYRLNSCPSSLYNKPTGILTSTNYPQNYLNYLDCYYQINAAVGERILLTINDFVTQSGYDYLQIYGERTSLKRLTGRLTNLGQSYNFVSASNYMGLQFHSDSSIVAKGWSATYVSKSFPSVQYINTTTGLLTNLNLPQNFANNTDYSYIIRVPMYSQINLQISNFECVGTVLTIFDGPLKQSLILGTLTGNAVYSSPIEYSSNYNYLSFSIKQVSGSIDNCALSLSWNTQKISGLCGTASFTQPKGIISSPGFDGNYPNNVNCVMQITVPQTKRISITMDSFITEQNSDYLAIYDGEDTNFPLIGKYTGDLSSQLSSLSFTSYKNVLTLVFYSDYAINAQGWQLHYETIDATKSITYYTNEGRINSNNFPLNYNVHDTEVYVIQNLYGYPIDFTVDSFSLASGSSLAFYDGGIQNRNLISSLSGSQTSPTIVTTSTSQVLVYFAAQSNDVSRGFSFTWNTTDADPTCPRKLYQDRFGEITSPNYPNAYSNNQDCYYYIIVEPGKRIELDFIAFNTESGFDILSIYDGPDTTSTPFYTSSGILQRSSPSAQIKSSSNVMTLWFHSDRSNVAT